jgi:hypothetical protein
MGRCQLYAILAVAARQTARSWSPNSTKSVVSCTSCTILLTLLPTLPKMARRQDRRAYEAGGIPLRRPHRGVPKPSLPAAEPRGSVIGRPDQTPLRADRPREPRRREGLFVSCRRLGCPSLNLWRTFAHAPTWSCPVPSPARLGYCRRSASLGSSRLSRRQTRHRFGHGDSR